MKISHAEAISSTFEVVSQFAQHGKKMHMCFYGLQKALDSVQYPTQDYMMLASMARCGNLIETGITSPTTELNLEALKVDFSKLLS